MYDLVSAYLSGLPDGEDRAEAIWTAVGAALDCAEEAGGHCEPGEYRSLSALNEKAVQHTINAYMFKMMGASSFDSGDQAVG